MLILILISVVYSLDPEDRVLNCYLLSQNVANGIRKEIILHVQANPPILSHELKLKVTEDGFNQCVEKATDEEIASIGKATRVELKNFSYLLGIDLSKYKTPEDVFVDNDFKDKTIEYASKLVKRVVVGLSPESKEDQCFLLSSYLVRESHTSISEHSRKHPRLPFPELKQKFIEESFYHCLMRITDQEVAQLTKSKNREYSKFTHLVFADLSKFTSPEDVKLTEDFINRRKLISKRVGFNSRPSGEL